MAVALVRRRSRGSRLALQGERASAVGAIELVRSGAASRVILASFRYGERILPFVKRTGTQAGVDVALDRREDGHAAIVLTRRRPAE